MFGFKALLSNSRFFHKLNTKDIKRIKFARDLIKKKVMSSASEKCQTKPLVRGVVFGTSLLHLCLCVRNVVNILTCYF